MRTLETTLRDYDLDLLAVIAGRWDVDLPAGADVRQAAAALAVEMLAAENAEVTWARLGEDERGALQMLQASGGRMTTAQFARLFGEIREMGPVRRRKETPYLNPANAAERLYYRGLIAAAFDENDAGVIQAHTYIPSDLRDALPFTAAPAMEVEPAAPAEPAAPPADAPPPDDTAVDDLTTLLAYLQLNELTGALRGADQAALKPHLLGSAEPARLGLLLKLVAGLEMVAQDDERIFRLARGPARTWLEMPRGAQARGLALAWSETAAYNDLHHVPGIVFEEGGAQNDSLLARQALFDYLATLPPGAWWSLDSLVASIKDEAPDFQRPTGEWDGWYVRDAETGEYLRGFESWDRVDGALVRYLVAGPMRWLGMTQTDPDETAFCLTAAGLAMLGLGPWDESPDAPAVVEVQPGGTVTAPRALSRYDRFQLARVAEWESAAAEQFVYRFSAGSLRRAAAQGVEVKHILAFLRRATGDPEGGSGVPAALVDTLQRWSAGAAPVALSRMVVMRTATPEELERLQNEPQVNRYLGRPLGPVAVEVRPGMWPKLRDALQEMGVLPELEGLDET